MDANPLQSKCKSISMQNKQMVTHRFQSTSRFLPLVGSGNTQIPIHFKVFTSRWIRQHTDSNPLQGFYLSLDPATHRFQSTSRFLPLFGSGNTQIPIHFKVSTSRWIRQHTDSNPLQGFYLSLDQATHRFQSTSRFLLLVGSGNTQIPIHFKVSTSRWIRQHTDSNPLQGFYLSLDQVAMAHKTAAPPLTFNWMRQKDIIVYLFPFAIML